MMLHNPSPNPPKKPPSPKNPSGSGPHDPGPGPHSQKTWFLNIFKLCPKENWSRIVMILWGIWQQQNGLVWESRVPDVSQCIRSSFALLDAWSNAQQEIKMDPQNRTSETGKWLKPPQNWLKCNVDGALFQKSGAVSAIFRDESGRFVGGYVKPGLHYSKPELLEVAGIREALSWIRDRNKSYVQVESDCLRAVKAINSDMLDVSHFGLLISDCKAILTTLANVKIVHIKRSANTAADALAKAAYSMSGFHVWGYSPPQCIHVSLHHV